MIRTAPKIIAHRGASLLAPENTLPAFQLAKELGATSIELDVHLSLDGSLVVHHDYSLGNPDNGSGLIMQKSLDDIRKADAGSWFSSKFSGEKIPTLDEVFEVFGDSFEYELELKGSTTTFLGKVVSLAEKHSLLKQIEFTSPHIALLCMLKDRYPVAKFGTFFSLYPHWMSKELGERLIADTLVLMSADVAHVPLSLMSNSLSENIHEIGRRVHVADCNTLLDMKKACELGCDQFSTNDIQLALSL